MNPDSEPSSPEFLVARAAALTGVGRERLQLLRWSHAILTDQEVLEVLACPDDGTDMWRLARCGAAELAILIGELAEARGIDPAEYLLDLIVTQTVANAS